MLNALDVLPDASPSDDFRSTLIVALVLAAAVLLWLSWYVPTRRETRRR
jgi:hypothetical protein